MNVGLMSVVDELGGHRFRVISHKNLDGQSHPPSLFISFLLQITRYGQLTTNSNSAFFSSTLCTCITSRSPPGCLNIDLVLLVPP